MTDRAAIQVGDLVVCIDACCHAQKEKHLGKIRVVVEIRHKVTGCEHCGYTEIGNHAFAPATRGGSPLWWLKRIPPLGELESTTTDEPMKEPA